MANVSQQTPQALQALLAWQSQYSLTQRQVAKILGISRRTVSRWVKNGTAPRWVAQTLDQVQGGVWVKTSTRRGPFTAGRDNFVRVALWGENWLSRGR